MSSRSASRIVLRSAISHCAHSLAVSVGLVVTGCTFSPDQTNADGAIHTPLGSAGSFSFGGAGGATGTGGSGTSSPDAKCAAVNQGATRLPPDILIVQDKSGSMDDSADGTCTSNCGTKSKWSQVTTALNQVV